MNHLTARSLARDIAPKIKDLVTKRIVEASLETNAGLALMTRAFHTLYQRPIRNQVTEGLVDVSDEEIALRINLVIEEFMELMVKGFGLDVEIAISQPQEDDITHAVAYWAIEIETGQRVYVESKPDQDIFLMQIGNARKVGAINVKEIADASGDLKYVLSGMDTQFGIPQQEVLLEIHASNMTKTDDEGNPIIRADGKILKGPSYMEPQLDRVIHYRKV